jgi:hypothetical protein
MKLQMERNLDPIEPNSGNKNNKEKHLTLEEMRELVRNLDVSKMENLDFKNALVDFAPEAKMLLGDKHNLKESLLVLSDTEGVFPPLNKEAVMKKIWTKSIILNNPDWDKIEKNGAVFFPTYLKDFAFYIREKIPQGGTHYEFQEKLYKQLGKELLAELHQKYLDKDPELMQKIKDYENKTGFTLESGMSSIGYLFPLEKQVYPLYEDGKPNDSAFFRMNMDKENFKTVVFDYQGHKFEIYRDPNDNTSDPVLRNSDNPFFLERFGTKFRLDIDGQEYKELSYDTTSEEQDYKNRKDTAGAYETFNSWRKWIGYADPVIEK